jgi:hypothetical protein
MAIMTNETISGHGARQFLYTDRRAVQLYSEREVANMTDEAAVCAMDLLITPMPVRCSHGQSGYCHDDATLAQRVAFETLHRHAYDWAVGYLGDRDMAERYAGAYASEHYAVPDLDWPGHQTYVKEWARNTNTLITCSHWTGGQPADGCRWC